MVGWLSERDGGGGAGGKRREGSGGSSLVSAKNLRSTRKVIVSLALTLIAGRIWLEFSISLVPMEA